MTFSLRSLVRGLFGPRTGTSPRGGCPVRRRAVLSLEPLEDRALFDVGFLHSFNLQAEDQARAVAVQPDGKLVVAGSSLMGSQDNFGVLRLETDGSLDTSFNNTGFTTVNIDRVDGADQARAVALQRDGKIVVAGSTNTNGSLDMAVVRLNPDGTLDSTFGTGGKLVLDVAGGADDVATAVAVQPDGQIVLAGYANSFLSFDDFAVARLNGSDGSLDLTFDPSGMGFGTGLGIYDFGGADRASAVALQPDGMIILAGVSDVSGNRDFAILRIDRGGVPDSFFGGFGQVLVSVGNATTQDEAAAVAVQLDGKIVVAGTTFIGANDDIGVVRLDSLGNLDATFDGDGKTAVSFAGVDRGQSVAIRPDGKLVVGGFSNAKGSNDFAVARLNPDGALDPTFFSYTDPTSGVSQGKYLLDLGGDDQGYGVAVEADGRVVLAGSSRVGTAPADFAVARVTPEFVFLRGSNSLVYAQRLTTRGAALGVPTPVNGAAIKDFKVGQDGVGNIMIFAQGNDNQVYTLRFDQDGNVRGPYALTKPGTVKALEFGQGGNTPLLFVIGNDNQVYVQTFNRYGVSTSGYRLLTPGQVKAIALGSDAFNNSLLFVIGLNDQVYVRGLAGDYVSTGPGAVKAIAVGKYSQGRPQLFAIGLDDRVYTKKFDLTAGTFTPFALVTTAQVKAIAVGRRNSDLGQLFALGTNNMLYGTLLDAEGVPTSGLALLRVGTFLSVGATR